MKSPKSNQRGVLLLESLVSILIISFGILGLVGLWAVSVKDQSAAKYRSDASFLANEIIGQMWVNRGAVSPSYNNTTEAQNWMTRVSQTLPAGNGKIEVDGTNQATVTVEWTPPGDTKHNFVSVSQINGAGPM